MGGVYSVKPPMIPDNELLREYADQGDEAAFAEVVRRHTDLVYSVALRIVRDTALAQDVTQTVFTKLARVAGALGRYPTPIGWLHTTTRHTAINAVRAEARRRAREHEAFTMQNISAMPDAHWEQLRPILDEAVGQLRERDRQAVLLRFFNGLSHQEVGAVLGLTENSAQKCVDRALEKLRAQFARRGVTVSAALLATAMSANSVQAAPVGLAADIAKTSMMSAGSGLSIGSALLLAFYMSTKIKTVVTVVVIAVILSGGTWWFNRSAEPVSKQIAQRTQISTPAKADIPKLTTTVAQVEQPKLPPATPQSETEPVADIAKNAASQAELNADFADIARLYRSGDLVTFTKTYTQPKQLNSQTLQELRELQQQYQGNPDWVRMYEPQAQAFEDLETQTPTFNATGDEATYIYTQQPPTLPNGLTFGKVRQSQTTFIKIDGKWYRKLTTAN